jgi:hypothetical protein
VLATSAPSLRLLVLSGSLLGYQLIQVYHHHPVLFAPQMVGAELPKVAGAPTFPAPTLSAVAFSVSEGADPSTMSSPFFFFNFLNLHSGGWNQGPLDTAAT